MFLLTTITVSDRDTMSPSPGPIEVLRMRTFLLSSTILCSFFFAGPGWSDERPEWVTPTPRAPEIAGASDEGQQAIKGFKIPQGVEGQLFAAEPMVANIVAFYMDDKGKLYACETFRQSKGVEDNRGHGHWLDDDTDYTREDDRIRLLVDEDGDHVADKAVVFADRFNEIVAGTGAGVLAYRDKIYYTCIPDLWMLEDTNGDYQSDQRESLHYGYGVRFAFRGHDLHGLTLGPDGRLYFSIGDRGYNLDTADGQGVNPSSGAVFRCELDGSQLEVFAMGLRNPQELAFDDYGNLFTGDNNSDSGDKARWVYVVEGGDTGWRMFYQYLGDRGPFNREKIWHPFHEGQPAYIIPPIANFADGPSGLAYYPGTGFSDDFKGRFFLCDFRGQASNSGIRSLRVQPKGAFYELKDDERPFWNILATDLQFGPDGGLYVSDWVNGWEGLGKGRIYRFADTESQNSELVRETQRLLGGDWNQMDELRLTELLGHADQRVRRESQFELVRREAFEALDGVARHHQSLFARLHALWGLEQLARHDIRRDAAVETFGELLNDKQEEIRGQSAKMLGDLRDPVYNAQLIKLVADPSPRVRYRAALALGKLEGTSELDSICRLLMENNNQDPIPLP
jgi:quinoprotein glucose dehydrogenase